MTVRATAGPPPPPTRSEVERLRDHFASHDGSGMDLASDDQDTVIAVLEWWLAHPQRPASEDDVNAAGWRYSEGYDEASLSCRRMFRKGARWAEWIHGVADATEPADPSAGRVIVPADVAGPHVAEGVGRPGNPPCPLSPAECPQCGSPDSAIRAVAAPAAPLHFTPRLARRHDDRV